MVMENFLLTEWVVFDLDDTLYLERDYVVSGFRAISKFLFEDEESDIFLNYAMEIFDKNERKHVIQQTLEKLGISIGERLIEELVSIYRAHNPSIKLTQDSNQFLQQVQRVNRLGLITGGRPETQYKKIQALGISEVFEIIIFSGKFGKEFDKPHPWSFREFEQISGGHNSKITYFGDNPLKDFEVPLSLNWNVSRIRRPKGLYAHLDYDRSITESEDFNNKMNA
jgi:putative hydrolase of the HAD superfamily